MVVSQLPRPGVYLPQKLRAMRKTYSEKLQDPRWQKKRLEILERDCWQCVYCQDKESTLHVHHLKYKGAPYEADNADLETVCKYCHRLIEYYKNFEGVKFIRYNCCEGKLFFVTVKDDNHIFFTIITPDEEAIDFCSFDRELLYKLRKYFK